MNKQKKNQALAATLALTLLVGGTYAWQSFSQTIINETAGFDADQGTRLHNDFNGSNADVYVENFASLTDGSTAYTRVRLHEYMEIGAEAGSLTGASSATTVPGDLPVDAGNITPDITDVSTWDIYLHEGNSHASSIRDYLNLNHGDEMNANQGATVYMPTFNKNFDDTTADINGSLNNLGNREDTDRDNATPYDDYTTYSLGESISTTATYSKDALIAQDSSDGEIVGTTYKIEETHTAKSTQTGSVITMEEWSERVAAGTSDQVGDYWVMDIDGWAYWANGLAPQTATSLLVDSISTVRTPDQDWHYGLHVVNQSATSDGWLDAVGAMNKGDIGEDALNLMDICWDTDAAIYTIDSIVMESPSRTSVGYGESLQLEATVTTSEEATKAKSVVWSIKEKVSEEITASEVATVSDTTSLTQGQINGSLSSTGVFTPVDGMHLKYYTITATAKYDVTKTASTTIMAYDPELYGVYISISEGSSSKISPGDTVQFEAFTVGLDSDDVTWSLVSSVTGASMNATTGLLTTANHTIADNVEIQVQATSKDDTTAVSAPITIISDRVKLDVEEAVQSEVLALIGTTNTLEVNGIEFYVLESGTFSSITSVKLLAKNSVGSSTFGSNNTYSTSTIRTYVLDWYNNTFLPGGDVAHADVVTTGTTTRSTGDPEITTSDYAFLLSTDEASALSTTIRTTGSNSWLRTRHDSGGYACYVNSSGGVYGSSGGLLASGSVSTSSAVRPALWIYL